jgi:hypothetical protein
MKEARDTIFDIAGLSEKGREQGINGFEKRTYKWTLVNDVRHGFTHDLMDHRTRGAELEKIRRDQYGKILDEVGTWLFAGPFALK